MRKRHHLLQQAPSKHLCLLQRRREKCGGPGLGCRGRYLVKERYEFCVRGERSSTKCHQSTSLRSLTGSSCTMLRWFMARLKAIWTALRMLDVRPSIILILSMVLSMPRGTILDLGSHCLKGKSQHLLQHLHGNKAQMFDLDSRSISENMSLSSNKSLKWCLYYYLFTFPFKVIKCLKEKLMTQLLVVTAAYRNTQTNLLNHRQEDFFSVLRLMNSKCV